MLIVYLLLVIQSNLDTESKLNDISSSDVDSLSIEYAWEINESIIDETDWDDVVAFILSEIANSFDIIAIFLLFLRK